MYLHIVGYFICYNHLGKGMIKTRGRHKAEGRGKERDTTVARNYWLI